MHDGVPGRGSQPGGGSRDSPAIPPAKPEVRAYWSESLSSFARFRGRCPCSAARAGFDAEEEEAGGRSGASERVGVASSRVTLEVDAVGALMRARLARLGTLLCRRRRTTARAEAGAEGAAGLETEKSVTQRRLGRTRSEYGLRLCTGILSHCQRIPHFLRKSPGGVWRSVEIQFPPADGRTSSAATRLSPPPRRGLDVNSSGQCCTARLLSRLTLPETAALTTSQSAPWVSSQPPPPSIRPSYAQLRASEPAR